MIAVTIPPELAADVAARPEAYRPPAAVDAEVLVLLERTPPPTEDAAGMTGHSCGPYGSSGECLAVDLGPLSGAAAARAWALVGSVDGGPRPEVGQHVLVRVHPIGGPAHDQTIPVTVLEAPDEGPIVVDLSGHGHPYERSWWALLPDSAESDECGVCGGRLDRGHPDGLCAEPTGQLVGFEPLPDAIPPGRWRQGSHAPRNLWIGGAYPEGVDVGRMDTPELAAYVVEAVNARLEAVAELARRDALLTEARAERDEARRLADKLEGVLAHNNVNRARERAERDEARAEVERLRAALRDVADLARRALGGGQ
jgi:hypothetical protein